MTIDLEALRRELVRLAGLPPAETRKLADNIDRAVPQVPTRPRYFTVNLDGPHRIITTAALEGWSA